LKKRTTEFRVGILVLVAIVASAAWLLFLGEFKFNQKTTLLHVAFPRVQGLSAGADVSILGVSCGKVMSVDLRQNDVLVVMEIVDSTFISDDARIVLDDDIINPTAITIEQGSSMTPLVTDSEVTGHFSDNMSAMIDESGRLMTSLNRLADRVDHLTANGKIEQVMEDLSGSARDLSAMAKTSRRETEVLLKRIGELTTTLQETMAENRQPLNDTLNGMSSLTTRSHKLVGDLDSLVLSLSEITGRVERGEGSLGKLVQSDELYLESLSTISRLDSMITEIMENPKKYISFELF
jgi:phospholipid/cholesterol/gamma-HCH transport system substrate-binding protein